MGLPPIVSSQQISPAVLGNMPPHSPPVQNIPDVLMMDSGFSLSAIWHQVTDFFKSLWESICSCFQGKSAFHVPPITSLSVNPSLYPHAISNPNKLFVYNQLVQGQSVGNQVTVKKVTLDNPHAIMQKPLFPSTRTQVTVVNGPFRYDASTANTVHWTANFADSHLFGFCEGPLLAQDELQVVEHPALAHVKNALPSNLRTLNGYEAMLFQNVPRLGALDTTTPLANGHSLYGNNFSIASQSEILSRLTRFAAPTFSNIFAIVAPRISPLLTGQPYQRGDLEKLFLTAYNAFQKIKEENPGKIIVIHTGNWGAGAFGNDPKTVLLIQLAAARCADIDKTCIYPLSHQDEFNAARLQLDQYERQTLGITVGRFLDHLTANAATYGLRYGQSNGT